MANLDLSQFYATSNNSDSDFKEVYTIEEVRENQGNAALRVVPCKEKLGKTFFACGRVRGAVSKNLAAKLIAAQTNPEAMKGVTMVISHVDHKPTAEYPNAFNGLLLHEQSDGNAIAVFAD